VPVCYTEPLTARETEVLELLATWLTMAEIGGKLSISTNTVKTHAKTLYRKIGVASRREAVYWAREQGLLR